VRTTLNLFTGIGFGLLLFILGVDYALLWGLLAFILSYVPYIGLFTAMIPPTILALGESGIVYAAIVVIGALIINLAIENIIEPRFTGKVLSLSPVVVIISFFFWGWLLGPTGALLSMPITVMIMLVTAEDERTQWIARIIGTQDAGEPAENPA
jgi:predicted PurR-regulated permease PerM